MKERIFTLNFGINIITIVVYVLNILLILQLIPVFESQSFGAKIVNLIVSPPNFFFEDVFGINSLKVIDILTWVLQFLYDYIIVSILLYFTKGSLKNDGKTK